jgi:hypothetical protein
VGSSSIAKISDNITAGIASRGLRRHIKSMEISTNSAIRKSKLIRIITCNRPNEVKSMGISYAKESSSRTIW